MNDKILFLSVAKAYSEQSSCLRRSYGAVIVDPINRIQVSAGFNGACKDMPHCCSCIRIEKNIPHNTDYHICKSVHAEMNALIQSQCSVKGFDIYLYGYDNETNTIIYDPKPCFFCTKLMLNAGIRYVITSSSIYNPYELHEEYVNTFIY